MSTLNCNQSLTPFQQTFGIDTRTSRICCAGLVRKQQICDSDTKTFLSRVHYFVQKNCSLLIQALLKCGLNGWKKLVQLNASNRTSQIHKKTGKLQLVRAAIHLAVVLQMSDPSVRRKGTLWFKHSAPKSLKVLRLMFTGEVMQDPHGTITKTQ